MKADPIIKINLMEFKSRVQKKLKNLKKHLIKEVVLWILIKVKIKQIILYNQKKRMLMIKDIYKLQK